MLRLAVLIATLLSVAAFSPMGKTFKSSVRMAISDLTGAPAPNEIVQTPNGYWDPLKLAEGKDDETLNFYRAAELKHGRVCMLASLGLVFQGLDTGIIPNPAFTETNGFEALKKVYYENPGVLIQIILAISAVEVLSASIESKGGAPGDFGWDPANIRPKKTRIISRIANQRT